MMVKNKIRTIFINLTGYFIYKKSDLPVGVDFKQDLEKKFGIAPVTVFDVGANYGQTALYYHEIFENATIYSFEPVTASYLKLKNNTKSFSNIKCFDVAFGETKKQIEIPLHDESNSQLNSLKVINDINTEGSPTQLIKVETLDNFVSEQNIKGIDLLKIDTEGFELEVLKGADGLLKKKMVKAILCEVALSKKNKRNTPLVDVIDLLEEFDYSFVGLYETNVNYYKNGLAYSNALFVKTIV